MTTEVQGAIHFMAGLHFGHMAQVDYPHPSTSKIDSYIPSLERGGYQGDTPWLALWHLSLLTPYPLEL
jgi:hypothetical protein